MNDLEKSDLPIVAVKSANEVARAAEELVERRGGTKENADQQTMVRTQSREAVSRAQVRIREAVTRNRTEPLTALLHHVSIDVLRAGFFSLKKAAAPGVDGLTWTRYAEDLEANLRDLHARVHRGAYRALASRRRYIPKADGRQRPLGIAALEDKIVQAAVAALLTPIYEAEFPGVQLRIPARAWTARCAGRARIWAGEATDQLGARCGHPVLLRHYQPRMAGAFRRAPGTRSKDRQTDPQMADGRSA